MESLHPEGCSPAVSQLARASASGIPGGRGNPVKLELATPGLAATGSPPWAAPAALFSMCREVGLEGRFSLWAGAGWWACGERRGPVIVTPEDRYPCGPENPDVSHPRISPSHPSSHPQNGKFWTPPQG
ncbi:hypothetical protein KIN20_000955 [Parelaphostrongylus tenuis]|uniref:Uncharacterized protein n=1 Tax=Parelaphostrongylus tenuis TaxID=148309 RepID=A0AAD5LTB9_PARTN|nr:hypothetical protein KIN20_000955 [Parelaphostrongylus tenuis]